MSSEWEYYLREVRAEGSGVRKMIKESSLIPISCAALGWSLGRHSLECVCGVCVCVHVPTRTCERDTQRHRQRDRNREDYK